MKKKAVVKQVEVEVVEKSEMEKKFPKRIIKYFKPNLSEFLPDKKVMVLENNKEKTLLLADLELDDKCENLVWVQLNDYQVPMNEKPILVPLMDLFTETFLSGVIPKMAKFDGSPALEEIQDKWDRSNAYYCILMLCTETEIYNGKAVPTQKALDYISRIFGSTDINTLYHKFADLSFISLGNRGFRPRDIIHLPRFQGKIELNNDWLVIPKAKKMVAQEFVEPK